MKSLQLFNAVEAKTSTKNPYIDPKGFIIMPEALWAKSEIIKFWDEKVLSGKDLNKSFHKSWSVVANTPTEVLVLQQILHYCSTYGTNFKGKAYIPLEELNIPKLKRIKFVIFKGIPKEDLINKGLDMLKSGIALEQSTIESILDMLVGELNYSFTGNEQIKNKEALIMLADLYNIYPKNPVELLRFIVFILTESTILIKNSFTYNNISGASDVRYRKVRILLSKSEIQIKMAQIFNRFKPIFLSMKSHMPKIINKISKLSKTHHKPMPQNIVNLVTVRVLRKKDISKLDSLPIYTILRALNACNLYSISVINPMRMYFIRNGKIYAKDTSTSSAEVSLKNKKFLMNYLKTRVNLDGVEIYIPKNIDYGIPTSEKAYVGNIPFGSVIKSKTLVAGIYWKNVWGSNDLDLSSVDINGKIGWDAAYKEGTDTMFSGDVTDAPNGATEFIRFNIMNSPSLLVNSIYSGNNESKFRLIIAKGVSNLERNHIIDPNKVLFQTELDCIKRTDIIGLVYPDKNKIAYVFFHIGFNNSYSIKTYGNTMKAIEGMALRQFNAIKLREVLSNLGAILVESSEDADIDLDINSLEKDTIINLFK